MVEIAELSEEEMQMIYNWVDEIPLSRPKRNIARDFADGGKHTRLICKCYSPKLLSIMLQHLWNCITTLLLIQFHKKCITGTL